MKRSGSSRTSTKLLALSTILATLSGSFAGAAVVPPVTLVPLNQIATPQPPNLFQFVRNRAAAVRLGKAFFWEMQAGSDGVTACGSCHFSAGADNRSANTLHPGANGSFQVAGVNRTLAPAMFPFHQRQAPEDFKASTVLRDADDAVGSQGVRLAQFVGVVPGSAVDSGFSLADPLFNDNGVNVRQVTGRNAPSVINAVFNFTNFWDGRASAFFNGSSTFGPLDRGAGVWYEEGGALVKKPVSLPFASLASQAVGPPLNEVEMSFRGRTFPDLGRKLLSLVPLGKQAVHPDDSELGNLSGASLQPDGSLTGKKGLKTGYAQMIRDAFQPGLWNSTLTTGEGHSQMEANFALFWGLSIQLYEATLLSDDTPFDRFLGGDADSLTEEQQEGFNLFFGAARCDACHGATELTSASVAAARFITNAEHGLLEVMPVASGQQILYDTGFNNTALRPSAEDAGRGGLSPFDNSLAAGKLPLSFTGLAKLQAQRLLPFATPDLIPGFPASFPEANRGAFKTPGLRNVELTSPYMHNGSLRTLEEVVDFYARGGNFPLQNRSELDINIVELPALQGDPAAKKALVAFLKSMTDDRVRENAAPFDRPEILIPTGDPSGSFMRLPATDLNGSPLPTLPIVTLNPVTSPAQGVISGSRESGASVKVSVNGGEPFDAEPTGDTTWSAALPGLAGGSNTVSVSATDLTGASATVKAQIFFSAPQPPEPIVINGGALATNSQRATLTLNASGTNPITQMQFSKDGVVFFPYEPYQASRVVTLPAGEGVKTMYVRFKDSRGVPSQIYSDSIIVDTTPPTGSIAINGGAAASASTSATLTLSAADLNGVTQMQFSKDGTNYYPFEPFAAVRNVTLASGDGVKTVYVRFKDGVGNVSAPFSAQIRLDTVKPVGSIAFATANPTVASTGNLILSASDTSGVTQMQFSRDGISYYGWETFVPLRSVTLLPGVNTLTVRFKDGAGNLSLPVSASITRN